MQRALIDTSVLYAAGYRLDERHEAGIEILSGVDSGTLPEVLVLDFVLAETANGLSEKAGPDSAVDFLERVEKNERFHLTRLSADSFATARSLFKRHDRLSLVDASLVALAEAEGLEYLYAFDDDFDGLDDVVRIDAAVDPFAPE